MNLDDFIVIGLLLRRHRERLGGKRVLTEVAIVCEDGALEMKTSAEGCELGKGKREGQRCAKLRFPKEGLHLRAHLTRKVG